MKNYTQSQLFWALLNLFFKAAVAIKLMMINELLLAIAIAAEALVTVVDHVKGKMVLFDKRKELLATLVKEDRLMPEEKALVEELIQKEFH